jgi:phosphohistidine phosphatase
MDIFLIRHAVAEERDPARWPDDSLRPLTTPGKRRFREAARGLARVTPRVDAVLSSPYERASETAAILAKVAGWPAPRPCDALAPGGGATASIEAIEALGEPEAVALVGHEPDMSELLAYLLGASEMAIATGFRKGGVAAVTVDGPPGPGAARLRMVLSPKVLRRLGG